MFQAEWWTKKRILTAVITLVLVIAVLFLFSQWQGIRSAQYDLDGLKGNVWNEVDRASQLLQQDAALLNAQIASQNKAIQEIARARAATDQVKNTSGATDTNTTLQASGYMLSGIRAFVEAYPDLGVGTSSRQVLDEIEGSLNRIEYARSKLISGQTDYNKMLIRTMPLGLFYKPVVILGSNSNPAAPVPVPTYVTP